MLGENSAPPIAPEDFKDAPSQSPGQGSIPAATPAEIPVMPPSPPRKPRTPNLPFRVSPVHPQRDNSTPDKYLRLPRAVQALYLKPLRRVPTDGVPCCDLQLRSYSVRNLEFFADFAVRVAYYLKLPAFGPHPLPRITEKWTVPKSHFIFKKVQENFMRITHRRIIQIKDGHPDNVKLWLAYLTKNQYHGIGMKANVWEWSGLGRSLLIVGHVTCSDLLISPSLQMWLERWTEALRQKRAILTRHGNILAIPKR